MKNRQFNDILNECLDRLLKGESVEQCLADYPEQADALRPLLQVAVMTKSAASIQPHPEFKARARYQFRAALQEMAEKKSRPFFQWLPQWATAVIVFLVLLLAGGSTMVAAQGSMPDEPLYPVKLASEQVRLALTFSDVGKAELYASLADKRVAEIVRMADKGESAQVERVARRLNAYLVMVATLASGQKGEEMGLMMAPAPSATVPESGKEEEAKVAGGGPPRDGKMAKLKNKMARQAVDHPAMMRAALKKAPEKVRSALLRAIEESEASYQEVLNALESP